MYIIYIDWKFSKSFLNSDHVPPITLSSVIIVIVLGVAHREDISLPYEYYLQNITKISSF